MNIQNNIYIGLVKVMPNGNSEIIKGVTGAYVNVVAIAKDTNQFITMINEALEYMELKCIDIDDVDLLSERKKHFKVDNALLKIANELTTEQSLRFSVFHTWE